MRYLDIMCQYQQDNNITNRCVDNCVLFGDIMKCLHPEKKIIILPVYFMGNGDDHCKIIVHSVVEIDGEIYDPSYETRKIECKVYFRSLKEMLNCVTHEFKNELDKKKLLDMFIKIKEICDVNNYDDNGFMVTSKEYYDAQADYIQSLFKPKNKTIKKMT